MNMAGFVKGLTAASALAFATSALADGPGPRRSVKDAPAPAGYSWTGAYIGLNAGYGWGGDAANWSGTNRSGNAIVGVPFTSTTNFNSAIFGQSAGDAGLIGGAQIGYNFHLYRTLVAGIEADIQYSDIGGSATIAGVSAGGQQLIATSSQQLEWFGTLRARLGVTLASDRLLAYFTGGLAYGDTTNSARISSVNGGGFASATDGSAITCVAGNVCIAGRRSGTDIGWALGGGLEWAISRQLTFRAEYLHIDLGSETVGLRAVAPATGNGAAVVRFENQFDIVRAGLNFRF